MVPLMVTEVNNILMMRSIEIPFTMVVLLIPANSHNQVPLYKTKMARSIPALIPARF